MQHPVVVTTLHISPKTAGKIVEKHGLDPKALREAVEGVAGLPYSWEKCPERGWRALVFVPIDGEPVQVVLYPSRSRDVEEWHLGSAYPE